MLPKLSMSHAFETHLFSCPLLNTSYSWYAYAQINQSKISWKHQVYCASTHHLCIAHAQKSQKNLGWVGSVDIIWSKFWFKASQLSKLLYYNYYNAQGLGQSRSAHLQWYRFCKIFEQPVPVLNHTHHQKFVFLVSGWIFLCCNLWLLHLILLLSLSQKNLHFFYTTDPILRPLFMISLRINSKVIHKKDKHWKISRQKRGRHTGDS